MIQSQLHLEFMKNNCKVEYKIDSHGPMLAFKMCDFASGSRVETVRQCVDSKAFSTFSTSSCSNFISSEAGSAESSQFLKCAPASMHS